MLITKKVIVAEKRDMLHMVHHVMEKIKITTICKRILEMCKKTGAIIGEGTARNLYQERCQWIILTVQSITNFLV